MTDRKPLVTEITKTMWATPDGVERETRLEALGILTRIHARNIAVRVGKSMVLTIRTSVVEDYLEENLDDLLQLLTEWRDARGPENKPQGHLHDGPTDAAKEADETPMTPEEMGAEAYRNGIPIHKNPLGHEEGNFAWRVGWIAAKHPKQEDDQ